jgi:hypothetical protein
MRANAAAISPAKRMMAVQQVRLASSATTTIPGTSAMSPAENIALLNEQRLKRPNSPHLAIYQPQVNLRALVVKAGRRSGYMGTPEYGGLRHQCGARYRRSECSSGRTADRRWLWD